MLPTYYRYIAVFTYEQDGIHVVFPDLPGCVTFGKDEEEAVLMAREALALHLYGMEQDGDEIPQASPLRVLAEEEDLQNLTAPGRAARKKLDLPSRSILHHCRHHVNINRRGLEKQNLPPHKERQMVLREGTQIISSG